MSRTYHADGSWTNRCEGTRDDKRCRRTCKSGSDAWEMDWRWETDLNEVPHEFCSDSHRDRYIVEHADRFDPELVQMARDNLARQSTNRPPTTYADSTRKGSPP